MRSDIIIYIPTYFDLKAVTNAVFHNRKLGLETMLGVGRFEGFEDLGEDKTTEEFCLQNDVLYFKHEPMFEEDVLNLAFESVSIRSYDVMILLGSDCWLEGYVENFSLNLKNVIEGRSDIFKLKNIEHQPDHKWQQKVDTQPVVFYKPDGLVAKNNHWCIYRKDSNYVLKPKGIIQGLVLHHDAGLRSKERNVLMEKYQDWNVPREAFIFQEKIKRFKLF